MIKRIPFYHGEKQVAYMDFDTERACGDMTSIVNCSYTWIGRVTFDVNSEKFYVSNSRTGRHGSFWTEGNRTVFAKNYYDFVSQEEFLIYIGVFV